ncbi:PspC domain-containing protein [Sphaerisporangium corydalis]|uniref:PspC domain-containing protein n=1 Tax=Sphaerisporangium corydalis TaxID=1441875 RepID=A0ABV9ENW1_9ACTN|nr:PspC domain-containing protein [Sphaerisporangium corydalis]
MDEERVLKRSDEGRMLTGVCAGLGRYTGMDPVIFRVGFAALVVGSGIGIMLYVGAFLLMRSPNGGPGYAEQWSRRVFDTETVMALLAAIFALGLIINLAADGISTSTVVVGTLLAIALLAAHARGVDLLGLARTLPERARGRRGTRPVPEQWAGYPPGARPFSPLRDTPAGPFADARPDGMPAAAAETVTGPNAGAAPVQETWAGAVPLADRAPDAGPVTERATGAVTEQVADAAPVRDGGTVPGAVPGAVPGVSGVPVADVPVADAPVAGAGSGAEAPAGAGVAQEYRRLADLAREARGASPESAGPPRVAPGGAVSSRYGPVRRSGTGSGSTGFDSSGEPFAPHGPYSRYTPSRAYEPHDWGYGRGGAGAARAARPKRPKSYVGAVTMFVALLTGGIMFAAQSPSGTPGNLPLIGGVVLITIGAGLLVTTWFGRGAGLVATGTIMSLLLVAGSTVNGIPRKIGSYTWEPLDSSQTIRSYSVGIGDGTLDLTGTKLVPGSRTRFDASVSIGELKIIVPRTARVEVFGYTRLGDVKIEHTVQGGADVHHDKVLEPDVASSGSTPVIELHVKAGIGDVEVNRAA